MRLPGRTTPHPDTPAEVRQRREHQNQMLNRAVRHLRERGHVSYLNGAEPGLGKTRFAVDLLTALEARTLVVTTLRLVYDVWPEEIGLWSPDVDWGNIHARKGVAGPEQVQLVNFETFTRLVKSGALKPKDFDMLIVDESSKMKSMQTQVTKALLKFGREVKHRVPMSGTPAPNLELEYWAQIDLCQRGALNRTFSAWRASWFSPCGASEWRGKGNNWVLPKSLEVEFRRHLAPWVGFWLKAECLDLPPITVQPIHVTLDRNERAAYEGMEQEFWALIEDEAVHAPNQLAAAMKLRQLTSGFMYSAAKPGEVAGETGQTKLKAALDLVNDTLEGRQILVVYSFRAEAERFLAAVGQQRCRVLWGGTAPQRAQETLAAWKRGEFPILAFHPASCGHGLTLTQASEIVPLSLTHSYELWEQTLARIHRMSQTQPCTVYPIIARNTIDEEMVALLTKKERRASNVKRFLSVKKMLTNCPETGEEDAEEDEKEIEADGATSLH